MSHPASTHVSVSVSTRGKCPKCGKRTLRSATFYSPRTANGIPVEPMDAYDKAMSEAGQWVPDHTHDKCRE